MHTPWFSFNGKNCGGCKHLNERGYCEFTACIIPCTVNGTIPEVKPQTNADRIRSMTDEELARFMDNTDGDFPPNVERCSIEESEEYWLDWLKQEVNNNS